MRAIRLAAICFAGAWTCGCALHTTRYSPAYFSLTGEELVSSEAKEQEVNEPPGHDSMNISHPERFDFLSLGTHRVRATIDDSPADIMAKYGTVVYKCKAMTSVYAVKQADAIDHQKSVKGLIATTSGLAAGAGGTISGASGSQNTSKSAGWVTAGIAVLGTILNYVVSPGDEGIKARNAAVDDITKGAASLKALLDALPHDPAAWTQEQHVNFTEMLNSLDASCDNHLNVTRVQ